MGHKAAERTLGIPDNIQDQHPDNPVPIGIRIGSGDAGRISDSEFTDPGEGTLEQEGVRKNSAGNIMRVRGKPDSQFVAARARTTETEAIRGPTSER